MFDNKDTLIQQMKSPLSIAHMALDEIQNHLGGNKIISDPNTPFCHLLEFGSTIAAQSIQTMEATFSSLYALRASTMDDLFKHMSDFDYVRMYSNPAQTSLRFSIPKRYLIDHAYDYNEHYKQVTIPRDTVFTIGRYRFGMYYPINIQINKHTNTFTTVYDTSVTNPLHGLSKNVVDKYDITTHGVEYIVVEFPVYQFARKTQEYPIVRGIGFCEKIQYNNQFYAVRVYTLKDGEIIELGQSQSHIVYDMTRPTALIEVHADTNTLIVSIPQVYLDNKMVGTKCIIEVYVTLGALDIDTSSIKTNIQANFAVSGRNTTKYSAIFRNLPFDAILQLSSSKIAGGSDAITVDDLRDRVVMDTLHTSVPITAADLEVYLSDNGFKADRYLDNITDRVWHAYRPLEDGKGSVVPSITLKLRITDDHAETIPTFVKQSDGSVTILPTTLYRYVESTDDTTPVPMEELTALGAMGKQELADTLNNGQYLKSPFHMRVDTLSAIPYVTSYNLHTPKVEKLLFLSENYDIATKMTAYDAQIRHLNNGVGGYQIDLSVYKSDDIIKLAEEYIKVVAIITTTDNKQIYSVGTLTTVLGIRHIYSFQVATNYYLGDNDSFGITNWQMENATSYQYNAYLRSDVHFVFLISKEALPEYLGESPYSVMQHVPTTLKDTHIGLTRQYLDISFGHNLKDVIHNDMEISLSAKEYARWEIDVPKTYATDVYERDENGYLKYTANEDGTLSLNKLANINDVMLDEGGDIIYENRIGDLRYDSNGNPIVIGGNECTYFVDVMFVDAKVYASERAVDMSFVSKFPELLEGYFDVIRDISSSLLERTCIYFRCVKSTGSARFNLGDGIIVKQNLEMSFRINCYVPSYVKASQEIQNTIREKTIEAIDAAIKTDTISMLDIFEQVKTKMTDYIDHFTLLGINGSIDNQTFTILDSDARPSIRTELVLNDDNLLSLEKVIDINFIALVDNTATTMEVQV